MDNELVQGLEMHSIGQFKLLVTSTFDNPNGAAVHQLVIEFDTYLEANVAAALIEADTDFHGHVTRLYNKQPV